MLKCNLSWRIQKFNARLPFVSYGYALQYKGIPSKLAYILAWEAMKKSITRDSIRKKRAISGIRIHSVLFSRLEYLTDRIISVISHATLKRGAHINRNMRTVNPESMRLNPKIKSYFPPTKRIKGNWVMTIAVPLIMFSFSSYAYNLIV